MNISLYSGEERSSPECKEINFEAKIAKRTDGRKLLRWNLDICRKNVRRGRWLLQMGVRMRYICRKRTERYMLTPIVIQSEAKNLGYIHMDILVYATEILPPFGRLNDK